MSCLHAFYVTYSIEINKYKNHGFSTVGSKIFRALEIFRVRKMAQFWKINMRQIMIFMLYIAYKKHLNNKLVIKPEKDCKYYHKCSNNR